MKIQDITLRTARPEDAGALCAIYAPYVERTAITFEYTAPSQEEFCRRIQSTLNRYPFLVAEAEHAVRGYAYASPFKGRAAYDWSAETSIYVDGPWRGRGIGTLLYRELERWLSMQHIVNLNACITFPNPASVSFHESFGYRTVAHFTKAGFKLGEWHDIIWMEKMLGSHETPPQPMIPFRDLSEEEK